MISDVELLSMYLLAICMSFLEKSYSSPWLIFNRVELFLFFDVELYEFFV